MSTASLALHLATVAAVAAFLVWLWTKVSRRSGIIAAVLVSVWLAISAALSISGVTARVDVLPPGAASVLVPAIIGIIAILFVMSRERYAVALAAMPLAAIMFVQIFRVPVEIVLAWLVAEGRLPSLLSYHGTNFDILTGLTAPLAVWAAARGYRIAVIAWNIVGLALVLNVILTGILAGPGPLQVIKTDPTSIFTMSFPMIWLPGFLVPVAIVLHGLALLKLRLRR